MTDTPSTPSRKVGIYERPASADRSRRGWVTLSIAVAVAASLGLYFIWMR